MQIFDTSGAHVCTVVLEPSEDAYDGITEQRQVQMLVKWYLYTLHFLETFLKTLMGDSSKLKHGHVKCVWNLLKDVTQKA
jgi:hypothetical protein